MIREQPHTHTHASTHARVTSIAAQYTLLHAIARPATWRACRRSNRTPRKRSPRVVKAPTLKRLRVCVCLLPPSLPAWKLVPTPRNKAGWENYFSLPERQVLDSLPRGLSARARALVDGLGYGNNFRQRNSNRQVRHDHQLKKTLHPLLTRWHGGGGSV